MSIKHDVQEAMKLAMKSKETLRLECLRMAKGALLLKEKESAKDQELSDEEAVKALRAEVKKRQQTLETFQGLGKTEEVEKTAAEIAILEEFLPKQFTEAQLEEKVRAFVAEHPEMHHAGKLTGVMKKELGDLADGKMLSDICRRLLGG
jgi:uncharacterized protein YqeY